MFLGFFIPEVYLKTQTSNANIVKLGTEYLQICMIVSFGLFGSILFERLLQATGLTQLSMVSQITGAVVNTILDPIMIFGLLGCPAMGIKGAAWATVIGQIAAAFVSFFYNIKKNKDIKFSIKGFKPA